MKRVIGLGGVFFQSQDAPSLREWYRRHLGIDVQAWGGASLPGADSAVWSVSPASEAPFEPGTAPFMVNYRVADLDALVAALQDEGCTLVGTPQASEYGKFAWVLDPEGRKVELWEPPASS